MKRKGFTLIELLSVIIVLAIIALIATPIVINIIEGVKLKTVRQSVEMYMHSLDITLGRAMLNNVNTATCEVIDGLLTCGDNTYTVETQGDSIELAELVVSEFGNISAVMKKDNYCIIKRGEETEYTYKKIVDSVNDSETEITENNCSLDPKTSEKCFAFDSSTGTITDYYNYENNASKGVACPRDVIIPKKIGGVEVAIIGKSAFQSNNLTSVVIPETVTTINTQAFYINKLTSLVIPEGVTKIDKTAFASNSLTSISLPSTLTYIAYSTFMYNKLPQDQAYFYKRNSDGSIDYSTIIAYGGEAKDITIPSEKNGVKLTTIAGAAFQRAGLTSVVVPEGVKTITSGAFSGNSLTSVSLPSTLTSLVYSAFSDNKLPQNQAYFYKRNTNGTIDYSTIIGYGGELKNIEIPSEKNGVKLTTIHTQAFYGNKLTDVIIPEYVTSIGKNAFATNLLKTVKIKNSEENVTLGATPFGTFDIANIEWNYVEEATE